ncbi:hypothetical protein ABFS83_06G076100 [Erythranthe nasuta]
MDMGCSESGDGKKKSELHDGESGTKKAVNDFLSLMKYQSMKRASKSNLEKMNVERIKELKLEALSNNYREEEKKKKKLEPISDSDSDSPLDTQPHLTALLSGVPIGGRYLVYNRDSHDSDDPEVIRSLKPYADMAIHVFNQRQPIKYSVVGFLRAKKRISGGFITHVVFTAKPDECDDVKTFRANFRHSSGLGKEVTYVEIEPNVT